MSHKTHLGLSPFGRTVHYWINNAAINGGRRSFVELTPKMIEAVVKINLLGTLYCTQEAMKLMGSQRDTVGALLSLLP